MTTPPQDALIRIVDDENDVCEALSLMLDIEGWRTKVYHRAVDFLVEDDPRVPGCLLLDVRMPNMTGLELQEEMRKRNLKLRSSSSRGTPTSTSRSLRSNAGRSTSF